MIKSSKNKALKRLLENGETKGIRADHVNKVREILSALNAATRPEQMALPGYYFHPVGKRYAVKVNKNWRITFGWDGQDATDIDLEDYH